MTAEYQSAVIRAVLPPAPAPTITPDARWDRTAASFGCTLRVNAELRANGTQYRMEYLPANPSRRHYHRAFTTTLFRIPKEEDAARMRSEAIIRSVAATAVKVGAKIREFRRFYVAGCPTAIFDYVLNGERNIGVIASAGLGMLAMQQLVMGAAEFATAQERLQVLELAGL